MKKIIFRLFQFLHKILPWWFWFTIVYLKIEINSFFKYQKFKKFFPSTKILDKNKKNIICFSQHPYTNRILKNWINLLKDKFNLITFWKVFSIYKDISEWDRDISINIDWWANYDCYDKLWKYYMKNNQKFFNKWLLWACDFTLPTQLFEWLEKNIIYLNHRFPYLCCFNIFKFSDWVKKINNLKQKNNILIASNNYDYEYHKYILWWNKKIHLIPPLTDSINDKYKWINNHFLIVPWKDKIFKQREKIIDSCINFLWTQWFNNIISITKKYKNKKYEFGEIAEYKALIVIPYTIYIWSIMDFLEMWMPMFFPSKKLLTQRHHECNLLAEYDFISQYTEYYWKNIFSKKFINKIENYIWKRGDIPSPYSNKKDDLEYWIWKSDWYTKWPIITFDSFQDLANKLSTTNMNEYSKILLEFNNTNKKESKELWKKLLSEINK